jgi:hypothetical protein
MRAKEDEAMAVCETMIRDVKQHLADVQQSNDDEVRALFVTLITFVAKAKSSHDSKNDALDAIQKLQSRLLP